MTFDYFYDNEAEQFKLYIVPKLLLTDESFDDLSLEAKIAYSVLMDGNSIKSQDDFDEIMYAICKDEDKVYVVLTELIDSNLSFVKTNESNGKRILCTKGFSDVLRLKHNQKNKNRKEK